MFKTLFAVLAAACALVALSALFYADPIEAVAVRFPGMLLLLVALTILAVFLTVVRPDRRRRLLRWALTGFGLMALAACASGCAAFGLGGGGGAAQQAVLDTAKAIAQDPNCGHTDRLAVNLGAISTGQLFLERNCPGPSGAKVPPVTPAAPPAQ